MSRPHEEDPPIEYAERLAGVPDSLQRLWTPYRMVYIQGENKPADPGSPDECPFCLAPRRDDDNALIARRGRVAFVILNLYPYNPGHLLVCPYRHVSAYTSTTEQESAEIVTLTKQALAVIDRVSKPAGYNLGINQGAVAGAGIAAHLHQHIVPRWQGDSNFLPVVGRTKALPQLLSDTRALFARAWVELFGPTQEDNHA